MCAVKIDMSNDKSCFVMQNIQYLDEALLHSMRQNDLPNKKLCGDWPFIHAPKTMPLRIPTRTSHTAKGQLSKTHKVIKVIENDRN